MKKSNNQTALAMELQKRMALNVRKGNSKPLLELGTIQSNMALMVDGLKDYINSYMVAKHLTTDEVLTTETDGEHTHEGVLPEGSEHQHEIKLPKQLQKLKAGDRVLVAWVGNIPIVVEVVVDRNAL